MNTDTFYQLGTYLLIGMGVSLLLAIILFVTVIRQLQRIEIPADAGFQETLLHTPFLVVIFIDLLDFGLDFLAAPFAWVILDRLGLRALRGVSVVEAAIPLTQGIPTMTLCWVGARLFR